MEIAMISDDLEPSYIDPPRLDIILNDADEATCRAALSGIEINTRLALELEQRGHDAWFTNLADALLASQRSTAADLRAELLLLLVQWHHSRGRAWAGIPLAEKAIEVAIASKTLSLQRRALSHLGILCIDLRNFPGAVISLTQALEIAEGLGDRIAKCGTLANLAAARFEAGLLDESIKLYEYVIDLIGSEISLRQIKVDTHHNIALAALALDDVSKAEVHMGRALELLLEPKNQFQANQRVVMELTFTKILIRIGHNKAARQHAEAALGLARKVETKLATIQSRLAAALCDAADGEIDAALMQVSRLEGEITATDPGFRDVLEIALMCNRFAGRQRYARYYNRKYLSHLAEWQRKVANRQIFALKRSLQRIPLREDELALFPQDTKRSLSEGPGVLRDNNYAREIEALAVMAESREDASGQHSFRVGRLAYLLAVELGMKLEEARKIELASRLHDFGKLATPDSVLLKRGKLTQSEMEVMRRHPTEGCQLLTELLVELEASKSRSAQEACGTLRLAAVIALHHHEWWDGTGYPRGIARESIPGEAQIVAVADMFDELTHDRPYKRAVSAKDALAQISKLANRQFKTKICQTFIEMVNAMPAESFPSSPTATQATSEVDSFTAANGVIARIMQSAHLPKVPFGTRQSSAKV